VVIAPAHQHHANMVGGGGAGKPRKKRKGDSKIGTRKSTSLLFKRGGGEFR